MVVTQTVSLRSFQGRELLEYRLRKLTVCVTSECETSLKFNPPIAGRLIDATRTESAGSSV